MRQALRAAVEAGVEVLEMSAAAPVPLFVLGHVILYRPTGCRLADGALVRRGLAEIRAQADAEPKSKIFPREETPTGTAG
jgi:hypothetical protein